MLTAATGAAAGHAKDLEDYLTARVKLIADGTAAIAADRLKGKITEDDAKFAFDEIRESERTLVLPSPAKLQSLRFSPCFFVSVDDDRASSRGRT